MLALSSALMSYSVHIVPRRVQAKFDPNTTQFQDALEREAIGETVLDRFTEAELEELTDRLALGWEERKATKSGRHFVMADLGADALLTPYALSLSCAIGDGVFEISQWASETVMDSDAFAKFDPQDGSWE